MAEIVDLKDIERKVWMRFNGDGLWEIYLGLLLGLMGGGSELERFNLSEAAILAIMVGVACVVMSSFWLAKRFITRPRVGRVKFGPTAKARKRRVFAVTFASVVVGLVLFVLGFVVYNGLWGQGLPLGIIFPAAYALNMLLVFGLMAHFMEYPRLYIIAVLFALPVPVDFAARDLLHFDIGYAVFAVPALIAVGIGVVVLARFLRENPVQPTQNA